MMVNIGRRYAGRNRFRFFYRPSRACKMWWIGHNWYIAID